MSSVVNPLIPLEMNSTNIVGVEERYQVGSGNEMILVSLYTPDFFNDYVYYASPKATDYTNPQLQLPIIVGEDGRVRVKEYSTSRPATGTMWPRGTGWSGAV